jgi:CBS domain-containing protein
MHTVRHILQIKGFDLWTISPEATVFEALRLMADKDVGALLVMEGERLVGMISERDYARKIILRGKSSAETLVAEIMLPPQYTIHPDQTVEECMEMMNAFRQRHLPVLENDQVMGVVSIGDVLRDIIYRQREEIKQFENQILMPSIND